MSGGGEFTDGGRVGPVVTAIFGKDELLSVGGISAGVVDRSGSDLMLSALARADPVAIDEGADVVVDILSC